MIAISLETLARFVSLLLQGCRFALVVAESSRNDAPPTVAVSATCSTAFPTPSATAVVMFSFFWRVTIGRILLVVAQLRIGASFAFHVDGSPDFLRLFFQLDDFFLVRTHGSSSGERMLQQQ